MKNEMSTRSDAVGWKARKTTVLLAEDEEGIRNLTRRVLEEAGYEVIVTDNGYSALSILQEFGDCIDVAMLDLNMPVMGGEWVLREMKSRRHDVPAIIYSGLAVSEIERRCRGLHVFAILTKPCGVKTLLETVHRAAHAGEGACGAAAVGQY